MNSLSEVQEDQVNNLHNFQQHSRLHFIGQWKTKMKDYLAQCFEEHPTWNHGPLTHQLTFIHMDLDAFFCSIQLAKQVHAHLRDKPVAIAAGHGNSDISSCNYVARKFGVQAGMYVNSAKEVCPDLVTLGYDFPSCERVVKFLYRIIFESFPSAHKMAMEVYSVDEVMIATDTEDLDSLISFCNSVREELRNATQCTISCGIGPNILLSRLATSLAKPDGVYVVKRNVVPAFMATIPFSSIHGAGDRKVQKVQELLLARGMWKHHQKASSISGSEAQKKDRERKGSSDADDSPLKNENQKGKQQEDEEEEDSFIIRCSDVQRLSKEDLQHILGKKAGETFYRLCRGDDNRVVIRTGDAEAEQTLRTRTIPSVACSMNYAVRPKSEEDIWKILFQVLSDVCQKLERHVLAAGSLRLTVLERHPLHPKSTQKFMGRGKCVEVHIPVRFPHPLQGHEREEMMLAVKSTLLPLLVRTRKQNEAETEDDLNARRAAALGVDTDVDKAGAIWTVTLSAVPDFLIEDIRGLTIQATQLISLRGDPNTTSEEKKRKLFHMSQHQQLTLTEIFSKPTTLYPLSSVSTDDNEVEEISSVEKNKRLATHQESYRSPSRKRKRDDSLSHTGKQGQEGDGQEEKEQDLFSYTNLSALMNKNLTEEFTTEWEKISDHACQKQDYFLVRACLRIAAFKVIQEEVEKRTPPYRSSLHLPSSPVFNVRNAPARLAGFEEFVMKRIPFDLDYS